ncbi:MAG: hypothetical protein J5J06_09385 [Phycisphaerae bacterium]|nr:hypothetical protein [Phycisphaerae bacterium]
MTFVANTAASIVADTRAPSVGSGPAAGPDDVAPKVEVKDSPNAVVVATGQGAARQDPAGEGLTATSDAVGLPSAERMAVPVDRAAVEDHFMDAFAAISPAVRIINLGVAREQLEREARTVGSGGDESFLQALRDRNLADIAVLFDVRVLRHGTPSRNDVSLRTEVAVQGRTATSSAEGSASTSSIITIALTGRAVRINDGSVIATVTPPRSEVVGEVALGQALRDACECGAAALASKMCLRLGDAAGRITIATVRVLQAPNNECILELMHWIETEFPGSRTVFRSFSTGQGEFTVELQGGMGDLILRATRQTQLPNLKLDAGRSSENTLTFVARKS